MPADAFQGAYGRGGGNYVKKPNYVASTNASDRSSSFKPKEKMSLLKRIAYAMSGSRSRKLREIASQAPQDTLTGPMGSPQNQDNTLPPSPTDDRVSCFAATLPEVTPATDLSHPLVVETLLL